MELKFKGGSELIYLKLDRKNKKAQISSSKTFYKFKPIEWIMLFDKGREKLQEKITDKLDDKMFKKSIIINMARQGYINVPC